MYMTSTSRDTNGYLLKSWTVHLEGHPALSIEASTRYRAIQTAYTELKLTAPKFRLRPRPTAQGWYIVSSHRTPRILGHIARKDTP